MVRLWKMALSGGVFAVVALASAALLPQAVSANPFFAQQTGQNCGTCHLPGRENEGRNALSPAGQSFFQAFNGCSSNIQCTMSNWSPAPPPGYSAPAPQPNYSAAPQPNSVPQTGFAKYHDFCFGQGSFFVIRVRGIPDAQMRFKLTNGHEIEIVVTVDSTWASQCGGWPAENVSWKPVTVEK